MITRTAKEKAMSRWTDDTVQIIAVAIAFVCLGFVSIGCMTYYQCRMLETTTSMQQAGYVQQTIGGKVQWVRPDKPNKLAK
jgi:hypothetical protein